MKEFIQKQIATCDTAIAAFEKHGDTNNLLEWFRGRRDANVIALHEINRLERLLP